jgi:predicted regulator of Ras-like GTPase activity (Roadblock/LC7/MglB family)
MIRFAQIVKTQIMKFPEVVAVVLSDASGALQESSGEVDGETVGAINAVVAKSLHQMGEQLGVGTLRRSSLQGAGFSFVLATNDQEVLGLYVDPARPIGSLEKKLDGLLQR